MGRGRNKPFTSYALKAKSDKEVVISRDLTNQIYKWGPKNQHTDYLISLYKGQPQHAGIINGCARYLSGLKFIAKTPQGQYWLDHANKESSWWQLSKKFNPQYKLFGARAIKVVPNLMGRPLMFFDMDFSKCRISIDETTVKFCNDWSRPLMEEIQEYPIWYPGIKQVSVYLQKRPNYATKAIQGIYPSQDYESAIKDIDTLKRIQNFKNSLVQNGMSTGTVLVLYCSEPEGEEEKKRLVAQARGNYTGDEEAGEMAVIFAGEGTKGAEFVTVSMDDLDKRFIEVTASATKNVFSAHGAPAELFNYIDDTSKVFDSTKIVEQDQLFKNTYVIPEQTIMLDMLKMFYKAATGLEEEFTIEQFKPVGINASNPAVAAVMTPEEQRESLGLPQLKMAVPGQPSGVPVQAEAVNEHLKNITGKQTQGIMRIVKKYQDPNGGYSEAQARILLKSGFGLTDDQVDEFLGIKKSLVPVPIQKRVAFARDRNFFELFDKYSHDVEDDEVMCVRFAKETPEVDDETLNKVTTKIKQDPQATNKEIATSLGITLDLVGAAVAWLTAKKIIDRVGDAFVVKKDKKAVFYTEYNYDLRPDLKAKGQPLFISTSRQWCRDFYAKFGVGKKALTQQAIDNMSNEFGENVWDYRGGWYGNEPYCRHGFIGTTKVKYV